MNTINTIYSLGLVCIYFIMGGEFTFWLVIVSALIATIPLATSNFFFALPFLILIWCFAFGTDPYGSGFAWLCIIYAPFYWTSLLSFVIDIFKGIFGIDD